MMDILLIDPPYRCLKGMPTNSGYYVGLTSLAAYLREHGIETAVLMGELLLELPYKTMLVSTDPKKNAAGQALFEKIVTNKNHIVWKNLADAVRQANPMAVGISYLTPYRNVVERIAGLIREIDQDIRIIAGSFHPTFCPEEVMQNPDIDTVVRGEGEIPLLRLMEELRKDSPNLKAVPGIHYRDKDGQVQENPPAEMISDLDELPFLARDLVLNCNHNRYRVHSISTTRGCPYTCSFCSDRTLWGGKIRRRSVDNVIEELEQLEDAYDVRLVSIVDGTFTFDRKYLHRFCNALIDHKLDTKWTCGARYDNLDEESLQLMKKANCVGVYVGLESGSERVLKSINKKITTKKIIEVSKMIYDCGIPSVTSVLLGLPEEGKEDLEDTLRIMKKVKTELYDVNSYVPLPGTPLYTSMSEEDKKNVDWRKVGYKSYGNSFSKRITLDEFNKYKSKAYKIANKRRTKTFIRYGAKLLFRSIANKFRKTKKQDSKGLEA